MRASGKCLRVVEGGVSIWVALMERTYVRNVKNRRPESCDQFQDGQTEKMRERLYLADVPELKRAELCRDVLRQSVCFIFFTFCFPRAERLPKRERGKKSRKSEDRMNERSCVRSGTGGK